MRFTKSAYFVRFILLALFWICTLVAYGQKVGVVLSGGGASGIAHVGVLKALEENNIPIDYIAGTSMGALVGGMYAMGMSPDEIEELIISEEFNTWVFGKLNDRYVYFFREKDPEASWVKLKFRMDSTFHYSFPTNLISPVNMDYAFLERTSPASAAAGYNFDSLFVPYRCVAADIHNKKEVVFREGDLAQAMRASSTYPFFYRPISVDGTLLFDGGLYNNFPADVMYLDFLPDVIIGSTVASEMTPPGEDDIYSQIKNMVMERTSYTEVCEQGSMLIIRPVIPRVSILDFSRSSDMVQAGYAGTMEQMKNIRQMVYRREDSAALAKRRADFVRRKPPLIIDSIQTEGLSKHQINYINRVLGKGGLPTSAEALKSYYFRLALDERIKRIYPTARINKRGYYDLKLRMRLDKDLLVRFGGLFSSRPINMGFIALRYQRLNRIGTTAEANAYFGKFYSSVQVKTVLDFPFQTPYLVEADFTANNFDYFTSYSTFFEDTKPTYLLQYERSFQANVALPAGNHSRFKFGGTVAWITDDYYQTENFLSSDTADRTNFNHNSGWLLFEHSTLNRKQYDNAGSSFNMKVRYVNGQEYNVPGSTSTGENEYRNLHDFLRIKLSASTWFNRRKPFKIGMMAESVISNQRFFNNYTATVLQAPSFTPVPESITLFLPQFRAHNYAAAGLRTVLNLTPRLELRADGYIFQPYQEILVNSQQQAYYGGKFQKRYIMLSGAIVFHTPLAPIGVSFNYYQGAQKPVSILFTTGFLIFNRRALN